MLFEGLCRRSPRYASPAPHLLGVFLPEVVFVVLPRPLALSGSSASLDPTNE